MGVSVPDLLDAAEPARSAMTRLRGELPPIFGDNLVAIWLYGGQLLAEGSPGDVDGHVVLAREPSPDELTRVRSLHAAIRKDFGIQELDVWYVMRHEAIATRPPRDVNWHEEARDENWALKRAHWYAGAYALVFGLPPTEVVPPPAWSEIEAELLAQVNRAEKEIQRSPWLALLTLRLCRVVRTLATRDVVQTKIEAAEALSPDLSAASQAHVAAAVRAYRGVPNPGDAELMRVGAAGFYAAIRGLVDSAVRP